MRITAENLTKPVRTASQDGEGPSLQFAVPRSAVQQCESASFHAGSSAAHALGAGSTSPRPAPGDLPESTARHPLESITPVGLVMLFLLSVSAGLVLALVLKVLSMALSLP